MKKLILFLSAIVMLGHITIAQTDCKCNPDGGWSAFSVRINSTSMTVNCGHQFSLKCKDTITIKGGYKCIGNCTAKYTAVLKNATTGVVIQNYPSFTFAWTYSFLTAGNYSLEITPTCNGVKCQPCRFFFTVTCPAAACDCSENGWSKFKVSIDGATQEVSCGHQFGLKTGQTFKISGKYTCKGDCPAKYRAELKNNVTGALIQAYPSFTFPWSYTFNVEGNYKLEIIPICGTKRCQPCVFYFTVKKP